MGLYTGLPKEFYAQEQRGGVSVLLVNTVKGAHIFDQLPLKRERRTLEEAVALVLRRREEGQRLKDAVRAVADDTGLSRNALYDGALKT